jgi:hypothetical protein
MAPSGLSLPLVTPALRALSCSVTCHYAKPGPVPAQGSDFVLAEKQNAFRAFAGAPSKRGCIDSIQFLALWELWLLKILTIEKG